MTLHLPISSSKKDIAGRYWAESMLCLMSNCFALRQRVTETHLPKTCWQTFAGTTLLKHCCGSVFCQRGSIIRQSCRTRKGDEAMCKVLFFYHPLVWCTKQIQNHLERDMLARCLPNWFWICFVNQTKGWYMIKSWYMASPSAPGFATLAKTAALLGKTRKSSQMLMM